MRRLQEFYYCLQIPSNVISMWLIRKFGRKLSVAVPLALGGICVLTLGAAPDIFSLKLILGTFGVCFIAITCTAIYIYSTELFPTVVRNMGLGLSSTSMRLGSMIAPFVSSLTLSASWLPNVIFGLAPVTAALLCILLPETKDRKLPDSIEDIEDNL